MSEDVPAAEPTAAEVRLRLSIAYALERVNELLDTGSGDEAARHG